MIDIKIIKNKEDYEAALNLIDELMVVDPDPDSDEGEQLALLAALVQDYESKETVTDLPDPIQAIKFRMQQADLKPTDLIPYLGTKSRVSEILSGKRPLTLEMIRALESGLGIPAKVLLQEPAREENIVLQTWPTPLLNQMQRNGYFGNKKITEKNKVVLLKDFFKGVQYPLQLQGMLRQSNYRSAPTTDKQALASWTTQILHKAKKTKLNKEYKEGSVDLSFMQNVVKLSVEKESPLVVQKYLKNCGIKLIIEPHLKKTRLDGATLFINKKEPVIGLTLRHDRLDNFWFTLMHELAHVALHSKEEITIFYDELDQVKGLDIGIKERAADSFAGEALIPASKWEISPAKLIPSSMAAASLAKELGIHPAIVAGKIRYEGTNNYIFLNDLVGEEKVRQYFPDENWESN